jgi:hypothetical protein
MINLHLFSKKDEFIFLMKRCLFFFFTYCAIILVCGGLISHFNVYPISNQNESNLLSTIIQSQAGILAIVITLSLVTIQITASQYSSTIVDYIKRHPDFWILLVVYTISIFYGLIILKTLDIEGVETFLGIPYASYVSLEFGITIYTFVILVIFVKSSTDLLKANSIINEISHYIDKKSIMSQDENFNLYFTILESSILKNDLEVSTYGLIKINGIINPILRDSTDEELQKICQSFFEKLTNIQILSVNSNLDQITLLIENCYFLVIEELLKSDKLRSDKSQTIQLFVSALHNIAKSSIGKNSLMIFHSCLSLILKTGLLSLEKNRYEDFKFSLDSIKQLGEESVNYRNISAISICIDQLETFSLFQIEKGNDSKLSEIIIKISGLIDEIILQNFISPTFNFFDAIYNIDQKIISKNKLFETSLLYSVHISSKICNNAIENSQIGLLQRNVSLIEDLYAFSIKSEMANLSIICASTLSEILELGIKSRKGDLIVYSMIQTQQKLVKNYIHFKKVPNFDIFINSNYRLAKYLIENKEQELLSEQIKFLGDLERDLTINNNDNESVLLLKLLNFIARTIIEKQFFDLTFIAPTNVIKNMEFDVFLGNPQRSDTPIFSIFAIFFQTGTDSIARKLERTTKATLIIIIHLFSECSKFGYYNAEKTLFSALLTIGFSSLEQARDDIVITITQQTENMRKSSEKKIPEITFRELIIMDISFGSASIEKGREKAANACVTQLINISSEAKILIDSEFSRLISTSKEKKEIMGYTEFKIIFEKKLLEMSNH